MNFKEQLISLRKQKGWSQEQLGAKLTVTRQTVSKWEMGLTAPEMDKLIELSKLFGISIDQLVGKEGMSDGIPVLDKVTIEITRRYEYKSKSKFLGLPLVHVNLGLGMYRAKGIIAIGNIATGFISVGLVTVGILSIGLLSLGILTIAGLAIGGLAIGGLAIGGIAIGGFALGIFSVGGFAWGMYSIGGIATASHIAAGGFANAPVAIGDVTNGIIQLDTNQTLTPSMIREAILSQFPNTPKFIVDLFSLVKITFP